MSAKAAAYQRQITRCSHTTEFNVTCGPLSANFDGYRRGVLLEAKYFVKGGRPMSRADAAAAKRKVVDQARRQRDLAKAAGLPLEWHVASIEGARTLCELFARRGLSSIPVYYTPPWT